MLEGKVIGSYKVIKKIGQGGMGSVYQAWDKKRKRFVGIKLLTQRVRSIHHDLFDREITLLSSLDHPNIVPIYDVGYYIGSPFFVMGYLEGASLFEVILLHQKKKKGFALPFFYSVISDIIQALHHAHSKHIYHRDLKPENILISPNKRAFLLDFGLGKLLYDKNIIPENTVMGTPQYMAPEQIMGKELDHRTDIYSLGLIMYVCLTARLPFMTKDPMEGARKRVKKSFKEPIQRNKSIPAKLNSIVMKCLEKDPYDRFQLVSDVGLALGRVLVKKKDTKSLDLGYIKKASDRVSAKSQVKAEGLPFFRKPAMINENLTIIIHELKKSCQEFNKASGGRSILDFEIINQSALAKHHNLFGTINTSSSEVKFVSVSLNCIWRVAFCFQVTILRGTLHLFTTFENLSTNTVDMSFETDFSPWIKSETVDWAEIFYGILSRFETWTNKSR